jgi:hypothetical protein
MEIPAGDGKIANLFFTVKERVASADCWNWGEWGLNEYKCPPSLVGLLSLSCWYRRFLFCLVCSCRPMYLKFFPLCTLYWAGSRAGSPACLLVCVSGDDRKRVVIYTNFYLILWAATVLNIFCHICKGSDSFKKCFKHDNYPKTIIIVVTTIMIIMHF